ncbi:MAG: hypothetical protein RR847_01310 [Bacilli bacterium]
MDISIRPNDGIFKDLTGYNDYFLSVASDKWNYDQFNYNIKISLKSKRVSFESFTDIYCG